MFGWIGCGVVMPLLGCVGVEVRPMMLTQALTFAQSPPEVEPTPVFHAMNCDVVMPCLAAIVSQLSPGWTK